MTIHLYVNGQTGSDLKSGASIAVLGFLLANGSL